MLHLNDRKWRSIGIEDQLLNLRLNRVNEVDSMLRPGEEHLFVLPSYLDAQISRLLLLAQGERRVYASKVEQAFQAFVLNGRNLLAPHPFYLKDKEEYSYPTFTIEDESLANLAAQFTGREIERSPSEDIEVDAVAVFSEAIGAKTGKVTGQ